MSDLPSMEQLHTDALRSLVTLGVELAGSLQAAAMAAEAPDEKRSMTMSFVRVARSVRQSIALEAKLAREARLAEREDQAAAVEAARERTQRRKVQLKTVMEEMLWDAAENEGEAKRFVDWLGERLDREDLAEPLAEAPMDVLIARLWEEMGFDPLESEGGSTPDAGGLNPLGAGGHPRAGLQPDPAATAPPQVEASEPELRSSA